MPLRVVAVAAALLLAAPAAYAATPAPVTVANDPCGDGARPDRDLARVDLHYSAASFQVRLEMCDQVSDYESRIDHTRVEVHLVSLNATVRGVFGDFGKYQQWLPMEVCTAPTACRTIKDTTWYGVEATGYGSWAGTLPGVPIPDTIEWYATVTTDAGTVDRVPDAGSATSNVMPVTRPSHLTVRPIPTVRWAAYGNPLSACGELRLDSATGPRYHRLVTLRHTDGTRIEPQSDRELNPQGQACGSWLTTFSTKRNVTVVATFDGDGFTAPSTATTKVLVSAVVSLDLPATRTVPRGTYIQFHGVVRPKAVPGETVTIQVRNGGAGAPWRTYATPKLEDWGADTAYYSGWRPTVTGTATFRTVWTHGTTADGGVTNGISNYATITVT
jgi:hypothetical protein